MPRRKIERRKNRKNGGEGTSKPRGGESKATEGYILWDLAPDPEKVEKRNRKSSMSLSDEDRRLSGEAPWIFWS
jgi:hypothetical protein